MPSQLKHDSTVVLGVLLSPHGPDNHILLCLLCLLCLPSPPSPPSRPSLPSLPFLPSGNTVQQGICRAFGSDVDQPLGRAAAAADMDDDRAARRVDGDQEDIPVNSHAEGTVEVDEVAGEGNKVVDSLANVDKQGVGDGVADGDGLNIHIPSRRLPRGLSAQVHNTKEDPRFCCKGGYLREGSKEERHTLAAGRRIAR